MYRKMGDPVSIFVVIIVLVVLKYLSRRVFVVVVCVVVKGAFSSNVIKRECGVVSACLHSAALSRMT